MNRPTRARTALLAAALLPIVAVNAAYMINLAVGLEGCFPYLEGCQSVSRAVRSGPGLWLFKALAVPVTVALLLSWLAVAAWLRDALPGDNRRIFLIRALGVTGAVFFAVYAAWLGTEGDVYRWLRRYGVVFYFAGSGLAHLLTASTIWNRRVDLAGRAPGLAVRAYVGAVSVTWGVGVASAFKRRLAAPEQVDVLENALEWNFALALSLCFLFLAAVAGKRQAGAQDLPGAQ